MALFSFYNVRKPRQYTHKPIYWDPHKEAMEDRIRKVKREIGMDDQLSAEDYKAEIKGSFIEGTSHLKRRKASGRKPVSFGIILIIIAFLLYLWHYLATGSWNF